MNSNAASQEGLQRQLAMQQLSHHEELTRLHKTIETLKAAVRRRDGIIRQMLDESCSLTDLPVLSTAHNSFQFESSGVLPQTVAGQLSPAKYQNLTQPNPIQAATEAAFSPSFSGTNAQGPAEPRWQASAEIDQDDEHLVAKVPAILKRMQSFPSKKNKQEFPQSEWCQWSSKNPGTLLSARAVDDVLVPNSLKLRKDTQLLFRGVSEVETGWFRGCLRLRVASMGVEIWSHYQRGHAVHAALDADALERRFIPDPSKRRVNFAQEAGEWQVLGRRPHLARVLIAQFLPKGSHPHPPAPPSVSPSQQHAKEGSESETDFDTDSVQRSPVTRRSSSQRDKSSPRPAAARPAHAPAPADRKPPSKAGAPKPAASAAASDAAAPGVTAKEWEAAVAAAKAIGTKAVYSKQPVLRGYAPLPPPKPLQPAVVCEALQHQQWVQPGVLSAGGRQHLVTRTSRPREAIPGVNQVHLGEGRLYVGVLDSPRPDEDEWILHMCGTDRDGKRVSRDARFPGSTALSVALLHDTLQRQQFKKPSGRRVNFAQEAGEWQIVPRKQCSHNARQVYLQYMPEAPPGLPPKYPAAAAGKPATSHSASKQTPAAKPSPAPSPAPAPAAAAAASSSDSSSDSQAESAGGADSPGLAEMTDEELKEAFMPPVGVNLRDIQPPQCSMEAVMEHAQGQPWLTIVPGATEDGEETVFTRTARTPRDVADEWALSSESFNARLYVGIRNSIKDGWVVLAITFRGAGGSITRTKEFCGPALQAAILHDKVQRVLIPNPSQRRVNFAQEPGEWQIVLQRDRPANARHIFVQFNPDASEHEVAAKRARTSSAMQSPSRSSSSGGSSSSSSALQRPPAALATAVGVQASSTSSDTRGDDSAYVAWLDDIAARVTTDTVVPGQQEAMVAEYLAVARTAAPRPLPRSAEAQASLHHLVRGVERRLYRCIRSSPRVPGHFELRGPLAALVNEQSFDTPYAAALAADEAVRRSVPNEENRLMNFKQPGSRELQYLPCSRNLRVSVYAVAPQLASPSGTATPGVKSASKRSRTQDHA